jgi:hypothetical protein
MDPLTKATLGIAQLCGSIVWKLKKFIDDTKLVGQAINSLQIDVEAFRNEVVLVERTAADSNIANSEDATGRYGNIWEDLMVTLQDSQNTLTALGTTIDEIVGKEVKILDKHRQQARLHKVRPKIEIYRRDIQTYNRTIHITLQAAIL